MKRNQHTDFVTHIHAGGRRWSLFCVHI